MGLGTGLGNLLHALMGSRRRVAEINVSLTQPELSPAERDTLVRAHFRNVGRALFESALSWWGSDARLQPMVEIEGLENLQRASAEGHGVILLSAHFTCFELGARMLSAHHKFQYIYKPQRKNPLFEAYTTSLRLKHFLRAVPHRDLRGMARGLKQQRTCWYLPDQDFGHKNCVFAPFMGVPASTVTATSRLATMTGARIVPFFPLRREDGKGYTLHLLPALEEFPSGDDFADAQRVNEAIGEFVRKAPEQYLWIHKRFKSRPEGEANPYP
jgi:KDO2-lipid IV(A) lauroyltransferase